MAETIVTYVLDSFAVMAHFQAESGGEKVLELLEKAGNGEPLKDSISLFWLE
jgi:PIN domain nuclease of toxin-antitoxin system